MNGSRVFTEKVTLDSQVLNVSDLLKGIYFAEVINDSSREIIKLIKQ